MNDNVELRQPETKAVMNWIRKQHFTASASLHGVLSSLVFFFVLSFFLAPNQQTKCVCCGGGGILEHPSRASQGGSIPKCGIIQGLVGLGYVSQACPIAPLAACPATSCCCGPLNCDMAACIACQKLGS